MDNHIIGVFAFHDLKLPPFFDLADILVSKTLTPSLAAELEIGAPYDRVRRSHERLASIFLRNPVMRQTKKVVNVIAKIRRKMTLFKKTLGEMLLGQTAGEQLDKIGDIEYIAHPYLKNIRNGAQSGVIAKAMEMAHALRATETLPKLTQLGLVSIVDDIATLADEANALLFARGEEEAFRKALGTAGNVRKELERQLRFLFYITFPACYANVSGETAAKFDRAIIEINGTLDIYRHLTRKRRKLTNDK
ncbi:MAG: hypothetical protein LBU44_07660 [Mediterranea sp.]|nr:hypothetical protein [Mediterranea sp.]